MTLRRIIASASLALLCSLTGAIAKTPQTPARPYPTPPALHVKGNELLTPQGMPVRLQGVNIASLEWSNEGDAKILESVRVAIDDWHSNAIRLPVCQDRWFGKASGQTDGGKAYRAVVDSVIQAASRRRAYIIFDLHWSDAGEWGGNVGQHKMPDANSVTFWKDAAARYANHPAVLFDLYNEPHDVPWTIWRNGGHVEEEDKGKKLAYDASGLQNLLETVRAAGARNVIVAGGLDWAYDLTGVANGFALSDKRGNGVIYATHIYPWKTQWDQKVGVVLAKYPVIVSEVGCEPDPKQEDPATWAPKVLAYIEKHHLSWTAWCFHPSASPRLLADWDYHPTPYWGAPVKAALANRR
jgi:aryl-phospho-beta-D-glucosidase BglC (GH1 family)